MALVTSIMSVSKVLRRISVVSHTICISLICLSHTVYSYGNECSLTHTYPCTHTSESTCHIFYLCISFYPSHHPLWSSYLELRGCLLCSFFLCLPGDRGEIDKIAVRLRLTPPQLVISWLWTWDEMDNVRWQHHLWVQAPTVIIVKIFKIVLPIAVGTKILHLHQIW